MVVVIEERDILRYDVVPPSNLWCEHGPGSRTTRPPTTGYRIPASWHMEAKKTYKTEKTTKFSPDGEVVWRPGVAIVKNGAVGATGADAGVGSVAAPAVVIHPMPEHALELILSHPRLCAPHHLTVKDGRNQVSNIPE